MWEKKTTRAYKHSFPAWMERIDFVRGRRRLSRRSEEVRSDGGFGKFTRRSAPTVAQSGA
jgi:hypothetical protein